MASVSADNGWLCVRFMFKGRRMKEYLNLPDTPGNRKLGAAIARDIAREIMRGEFDYMTRFPNSRALFRLGLVKRSEESLGSYAQNWLKQKQAVLSASSFADYGFSIEKHLIPSPISRKLIREVNDGDIHLFLGELQKRTWRGQPISARRINMTLARLRSIFAVAVQRKDIESDPMKLVPNLREAEPEIDPFDLDEIVAILAHAQDWERTFLSTLFFTGLRPNEALALEWDDLDFVRMKIRVRRTNSRFGVHLPKTKRSVREVDMLDAVKDELQAQRSRTQLRGALVFRSERNTGSEYVDLSWFTGKRWQKILRDAKVRHRNIYQCRHSYATLRLTAGDSVQYVADQLGHTTISMVVQHYSRWTRTPISLGASALNKSIAAAKGGGVAKAEVS